MAATRSSGSGATLGLDIMTGREQNRKSSGSLEFYQESTPVSNRSRQSVMNRKDSSRETSPSIGRSRAEKFHKLFKSVPDDENPVDYFSCAFLGDNLLLLQGNLYVSQHWFCFYSRIRARGRLLEIPMEKIISITREKTALIIPNAIGLQTAKEKYVFGSFISRDSTYKFVYSMWKKAQQKNDIEFRRNDSNTDLPFTMSLEQMISDIPEADYNPGFSDSYLTQDNDNNNISTGQRGSERETDSSVCRECGVVDACDANIIEKPPTNEQDSSTLPCPPVYVQSETRNRGGNSRGKYSIPYVIQCFDCKKMYAAFSQLGMKFQKIPRTNLLLAVCSIMVLFLLLSAVGLTYKILVLQAKLEAKDIWSPASQYTWREKIYSTIYSMQSDSHIATVKQLHTVLQSNIQILEEISDNLKNLNTHTKGTCEADGRS